jgi:hypothetical protein
MRKLPAIALGFVLVSAGVAVMANSSTSTASIVETDRAATISVEAVHKSIDVAALPQHPNYDSF